MDKDTSLIFTLVDFEGFPDPLLEVVCRMTFQKFFNYRGSAIAQKVGAVVLTPTLPSIQRTQAATTTCPPTGNVPLTAKKGAIC